MKLALVIPFLLVASIGQATVSKSVSCRLTRDDGTTQRSSQINKNLVLNDEGGLAQSDLLKDSKVEVTAYSSDYKPDAGSRLFLDVNGIVVSAEADSSSKAKLEFTRTGDATYTYDCKFN